MPSTKPRLPDGLVVIVKEECATCKMVEPLLPEIAKHSSLAVFTQDNPAFPSTVTAQHDADLAVSWHYDVETVPTFCVSKME
jgi:hypothetical protein